MIIFVSIKKLVQTFWWLIAAIAFYIFFENNRLKYGFSSYDCFINPVFCPSIICANPFDCHWGSLLR